LRNFSGGAVENPVENARYPLFSCAARQRVPIYSARLPGSSRRAVKNRVDMFLISFFRLPFLVREGILNPSLRDAILSHPRLTVIVKAKPAGNGLLPLRYAFPQIPIRNLPVTSLHFSRTSRPFL